MATIFLDEAGYTGRNLSDPDQPILTIASHVFPPDVCRELKELYFPGVRALELKYSSLSKRPRTQTQLLDFFREMSRHPEMLKFSIAHKKFALLSKIVDLLIEPAMAVDGVDLYHDGGNIAYSNLLYYFLPAAEGQEYFDEVLSLFQRMMLSQSIYDFVLFFDTVINYPYQREESYKIFAVAVAAARRSLGTKVLRISNYTLDLGVTSALALLNLWRKELPDEDDFTVIHDVSSAMDRERLIWHVITNPDVPKMFVGHGDRTLSFPIAVSSTVAADSREETALQIADLLAGGINEASRSLLVDEDNLNEYGIELESILNDEIFSKHSVWPRLEVDPEKLGTLGGEVGGGLDTISDLLMRGSVPTNRT